MGTDSLISGLGRSRNGNVISRLERAKADVCCQRDSKLGLGPANLTDIWTWIEG